MRGQQASARWPWSAAMFSAVRALASGPHRDLPDRNDNGRTGQPGYPGQLDPAVTRLDVRRWLPAGVNDLRGRASRGSQARKSASSRSSADLGLAPTIDLTTSPSLNTLSVGMFMIP